MGFLLIPEQTASFSLHSMAKLVVIWGSVVVKTLRYWSGGLGIDSRWCHWGFFLWYPQQNHGP